MNNSKSEKIVMLNIKEKYELSKAIVKNLRILKAPLPVILFLFNYLQKFKISHVGENYIIHSHLPPVNSGAYARFINEHLLSKSFGPSHAQIGITDKCGQNCDYCYNKKRSGIPMDTEVILKTVHELKELGVFWLGLTGGEPLLNQDIVRIIENASADCAVKLFTTGCSLTRELAEDMKNAGLCSVSVSLDHWIPEEHDAVRNYPGAYSQALKAIEIFKSVGGIHIGVSAVISKSMLNSGEVEKFISFLEGLGLHEAWLSETKPSIEPFWESSEQVTEAEKNMLSALQDRNNRKPGMTVNYLGHFESAQNFGCNAGHKMVSIDPFGEVSPCVFIPMSFGNVKDKSIKDIWSDMRKRFPSEKTCFINKNYGLLKKYYQGKLPIGPGDSAGIMSEVTFGPRSRFIEMNYGRNL